jgi:signal transduction histidine kinase
VLGMATTLPLRSWTPWLAGLPVMMSAGFWRQPYGGLLDPAIWPAAVFGSAAVILPAVLVVLRRARREADAREWEVERDRYVYDVVGHGLAVIHLQAGVALHVLDKRPEQVAASLEAIRVTSKDALAELRHTLGMFRDADGPDPTGPPAGLRQLEALVTPLRAAGRSVEIRTIGDVRGDVPAAVDHAAYRIVQEALTNVVRHAGESSVIVELMLSRHQLRIVVSDDGPAVSAGALDPGNGISGMRERATAVGGRLEVRPGTERGTVVEAVLPIVMATVDE